MGRPLLFVEREHMQRHDRHCRLFTATGKDTIPVVVSELHKCILKYEVLAS
jgi:hypothetical protein